MNRNSLLEFGLFHPISLRKNLTVGQFVRLKRLCFNTNDYKIKAIKMFDWFKMSSYPAKVVKQAYNRARYAPRDSLLSKKEKNLALA